MTPEQISNPVFRHIVENTFRADGTLNPGLFVEGLTEGATFQLGASAPVVGRDAIQAMLVETFAVFKSVEHTLTAVYEREPETLIYEATVLYTFVNGDTKFVEYANILKFEGPLVWSYRVYIDL
jgi:hypothetical protein